MRRVCAFVGSRANYASIRSVLSCISVDSELELQLVLGASAVVDRFGDLRSQIKSSSISINAEIFMLLEGATPLTMAKSTGLGIIELATAFDRLGPDIILIVGDRFETMAASVAAAYMNCPIAHTMGGEVSGTIDESIRHANTKLAHVHFCATKRAKERVLKLGEEPSKVFNVGCPRIDVVREIIDGREPSDLNDRLNSIGVGDQLDFDKSFVVLSQHPVTTEYESNAKHIQETIAAIQELEVPSLVLWPNSDAGNEQIAREFRKLREMGATKNIRFIKNLAFSDYINLLARASCLVGNSSSGIREGAFIGTPVVNIGTRQNCREQGANVLNVTTKHSEIAEAISRQISHGPYPRDPLYGKGYAAESIVKILKDVDLSIQKRLAY